MTKLAAVAIMAAGVAFSQVRFNKGADQIDISIDGRPFTTFVFRQDLPKPFLAPIRAASGTIVTRLWPMDAASTESHDHPHHRGLFFGDVNVNGFDFWGNDPSVQEKNGGRIVLHKIEEVSGGEKDGTIRATFDWKDTAGRVQLTERRMMIFHADPHLRVMDFDITLAAAQNITFYDDKDGGFAIRLADPLNEGHSGTMVNSEGAEREKNTWGHRAAWMDYYGAINGEKLGIAIFDHPSNPGYPNRWHCRGYGLFALNPFAFHAFDPALPVKNTHLAAGQSLRYRWRVVIHPGDVKSADIAGLFRSWSGQQ